MKKFVIISALILVVVILWNWKKNNNVVVLPGVVPTRTVEVKKIDKFGVMADIHNDILELKKALEIAKADRLEIVVLAGDLTINGNKSELTSIKNTLDESGVKYLVVPGNHDLYKKMYGQVFGKDYQVYRFNGLKLLLINNGDWRGMEEAQKKWLMTEVQECLVIKCVGIMHMPLSNNFSAHIMGEDSDEAKNDRDWLNKLLVDYKVGTIYTGHLHYSSSYDLEGLTTNIVGAISNDRNTQTPRFVEVSWDGQTLSNTVKILE